MKAYSFIYFFKFEHTGNTLGTAMIREDVDGILASLGIAKWQISQYALIHIYYLTWVFAAMGTLILGKYTIFHNCIYLYLLFWDITFGFFNLNPPQYVSYITKNLIPRKKKERVRGHVKQFSFFTESNNHISVACRRCFPHDLSSGYYVVIMSQDIKNTQISERVYYIYV